jgi:hypothetical protein
VRRLGAVGIVFVGLLTIAGTIPLIGDLFAVIRSGAEDGSLDRVSVAFSICGILVALSFAVALILGRDWLSRRWFDDAETGVAVDAVDLLRIGLVLIGVSVILAGLRSAVISASSGIVQALSVSAFADSGDGSTIAVWGVSLVGAAFGLLQVVFGGLLVRFSKRLAPFIWALPTARQPQPEPVPATACPACGHPYDPGDYRDGAPARCVECHALLDGSEEVPETAAVDDGSGFDTSD